jgi:hypothetical protein
MGAFGELYAFCQGLTPPVDRNAIRDKILELTGTPKVQIVMSGLNTDLVYGYYVSAKKTDHQFVKQTGGAVVVVARGLNRCWTRFVVLKELMHLFDSPLEHTNTGPDLEAVLMHFASPSGPMSPQMQSEFRCFWMALACICPENLRAELQQKRDSGTMTDLEIATMLRMPEKYIPNLFHERFKEVVTALVA